MALTLSQIGIETTNTVEAWHVTQSIDAFTGAEAYDITLSGSLTLQNGTEGADKIAVSNGLGEISFTNNITASLQGTASYADSSSYALTASYIQTAQTSSYALNAVSASYAPNFANTDLIFTGNRTHNTDGNYLWLQTSGSTSGSLIYMDSTNWVDIGWVNPANYARWTAANTQFYQNNISRIHITSSETIINDTGTDIDFRIEGDTNPNLFFVDASTDNIGIGKNTPNTILDISGSATISGSLITSGSRVRNYRTITLTNSDFSTTPPQQILSTDDIVLVIDNTTSTPAAGTGSLNITNFLNSTAGRCVEIVKVKDGTGGGIVITALTMTGNELHLNNISDANGVLTICPNSGQSVTLMSMGLSATGSIWGTGY